MNYSKTNQIYEGRIIRVKYFGKLCFLDILHNDQVIQGVLKKDLLGDKFPLKKRIQLKDLISMSGVELSSSQRKISIDVTEYTITQGNEVEIIFEQETRSGLNYENNLEDKVIECSKGKFNEAQAKTTCLRKTLDLKFLKSVASKAGFGEYDSTQYANALNNIHQYSVDVAHFEELRTSLLESLRDKSAHFLYYLCLHPL